MKGLTLVPLLGQGLVNSAGVTHVVALAVTLGTWLLGGVLPAALVLAVVQCGESQDVEKEQRRANSNSDAELRGVISRVRHDQGTHLPPAFAVIVGSGNRGPASGAGPLPIGLGGLQRGNLCGCGGVVKHVVKVVEMGHQVFPEGHLSGAVVIADTRLQANVQVQLVVWVVFGPGHLLEAVSLGVDELGVLWHRLVGVPRNTSWTELLSHKEV